jgi:hypothetical protein
MHIVAYHVPMDDENMEFYVDLDGKFEIPLFKCSGSYTQVIFCEVCSL